MNQGKDFNQLAMEKYTDLEKQETEVKTKLIENTDAESSIEDFSRGCWLNRGQEKRPQKEGNCPVNTQKDSC